MSYVIIFGVGVLLGAGAIVFFDNWGGGSGPTAYA